MARKSALWLRTRLTKELTTRLEPRGEQSGLGGGRSERLPERRARRSQDDGSKAAKQGRSVAEHLLRAFFSVLTFQTRKEEDTSRMLSMPLKH